MSDKKLDERLDAQIPWIVARLSIGAEETEIEADGSDGSILRVSIKAGSWMTPAVGDEIRADGGRLYYTHKATYEMRDVKKWESSRTSPGWRMNL